MGGISMTMRSWALCLLLPVGLLASGCGSSTDPGEAGVLSGRVTLNGQPVKDATVVVVGPDRSEASGLSGAEGEYRIANPPKGLLRFRLSSFVPPPPPGVQAPPPPPGVVAIPRKYTTLGNGLEFNYAGGKQTFDIDLK